jgi:hypothetical protein
VKATVFWNMTVGGQAFNEVEYYFSYKKVKGIIC